MWGVARRCRIVVLVALGVLLETPFAHAQPVMRFAATYQSSPEFSTSASVGSGGSLLYDQTVKVPAAINTLFVTISGAGDVGTINSTRLFLNCQVDTVNCKSGTRNGVGSPPNWINLLVDPSNTGSEDHSFSYTWCTPISKGANGTNHEVRINVASSTASSVFLEKALVTIDGVKIANPALACSTSGF